MNCLRILCYHAVDAEYAERFARQLDHMRDEGFVFRPMQGCLGELRSAGGNRWATVSFDDGDASVCEVAQPILDERGIKAVLYLTTDYVRQGQLTHLPSFRRAVTWEQLERWVAAGHEIGSHTHTHVLLNQCSQEVRMAEVFTSRDILSRRFGVAPRHFSYPWGKPDPATRELLERGGEWESAVSCEAGWNTYRADPWSLRRDTVEPHWGVQRLRFRLSLGPYEPLRRAVRWFEGRTWSS